ncbi:hypothetical protein Tco_1112064 [Tanacetum coccineum]|uniref:Uncharacterized protein n=1 Tax=Tanacetum coccineum TaxID=301880 RepID=A0ABQ5INV1_9ASTR
MTSRCSSRVRTFNLKRFSSEDIQICTDQLNIVDNFHGQEPQGRDHPATRLDPYHYSFVKSKPLDCGINNDTCQILTIMAPRDIKHHSTAMTQAAIRKLVDIVLPALWKHKWLHGK